MIKSYIGLDMHSIQLIQDPSMKNVYLVEFSYSCRKDAKITIHFGVNMDTTADGLPSAFHGIDEMQEPIVADVKIGNNQKFDDKSAIFDVETYEGSPLFNATNNYFPGVIVIEPSEKPHIDSDGISNHQQFVTFCSFHVDGKTNLMKIKPIKQIFIAYEMGFNLKQIYGVKEAFEDAKSLNDLDIENEVGQGEDSQLCVVCLTDEKNTIVMPGGHGCMCVDGGESLENSPNPKCPIGRKPIQSHISLNIQTIKKLDARTSTFTKALSRKESKKYKSSTPSGFQL